MTIILALDYLLAIILAILTTILVYQLGTRIFFDESIWLVWFFSFFIGLLMAGGGCWIVWLEKKVNDLEEEVEILRYLL